MIKLKDRIGEIKEGNYGLMKIIEYNDNRNIKVKFKTGSIIKAHYNQFKKGQIKDPLFPSIYGIGYIGIGNFKGSLDGKHTKEYTIWNGMLQRCYDPYWINKNLTYQNTTVCKEWWNFQTFAEWFHKNYFELIDERADLDKDLIKIGNKIYCPEYCSFVPHSINTILVKRNKFRGKYPIGVYFRKDVNKYMSQISINNKLKCIGLFSTIKEAFNVYKIEKEKQIKIMANKYKDVLDNHIYNSLMEYKVLITD